MRTNTTVALVSSFYPETNYSRYLADHIIQEGSNTSITLLVYGEVNNTGCGQKHEQVWKKGCLSLLYIARKIYRDRPNVVHFQHEVNMYGGVISSVLFPILVYFAKLLNSKVVVTIHAVPCLNEINHRFVKLFRGDSTLISPQMLKIYFQFLYKLINLNSESLIVHTNLLKKNLCDCYNISEDKVRVINHGVFFNKKNHTKNIKKNYFLYFGYLTRRKGIEDVIDGFCEYINIHKGSDFKLILSGGVIKGQEFAYEEIVNRIKSLNMEDRIQITGFIDENKIKSLFSEAYAVVIPAEISISASGPLAQAYSYSKCVLASNIGSFVEEINNGVDGLLVNTNLWGDILEYAIDHKELVDAIEDNANKKAYLRSWDKIAIQHIEVYKYV
jgi:glycosyltransferase involved in cell wall biosynthesis